MDCFSCTLLSCKCCSTNFLPDGKGRQSEHPSRKLARIAAKCEGGIPGAWREQVRILIMIKRQGSKILQLQMTITCYNYTWQIHVFATFYFKKKKEKTGIESFFWGNEVNWGLLFHNLSWLENLGLHVLTQKSKQRQMENLNKCLPEEALEKLQVSGVGSQIWGCPLRCQNARR